MNVGGILKSAWRVIRLAPKAIKYLPWIFKAVDVLGSLDDKPKRKPKTKESAMSNGADHESKLEDFLKSLISFGEKLVEGQSIGDLVPDVLGLIQNGAQAYSEYTDATQAEFAADINGALQDIGSEKAFPAIAGIIAAFLKSEKIAA